MEFISQNFEANRSEIAFNHISNDCCFESLFYKKKKNIN